MRYKKEGVGAETPTQIIGFELFSHARRVTIFRTYGSIARVGIASQRRIRHSLRVRVLATRRERYDAAFRPSWNSPSPS